MKLTRCKKIFLIIALTAFVVLLFSSNTAFAAINTEYSGTDTVPDDNLEEAFDGSGLLGLLARLIYAVGRFLEWILGTIFKLLTGSSDFPWADKIVFNAVPLLDVNFINPGAGSFVAQESIQNVLKNLYATILTLAATFFGIVVLITAIKLVISTIASDKAKYKQAIVDWLIGFVMLFCIHYAISFIFYLNEQLVVVASKIVKVKLDEKDVLAKVQLDENGIKLIEDARKKAGNDVAKILEDNPMILTTWMNLASNDTSKGVQDALQKDMRWHGNDTKDNKKEQYENLAKIISWAAEYNVSVKRLNEIKNNIKVFTSSNLLQVYQCDDVHWGLVEDIVDMVNGEWYVAYTQALSKDEFEEIFKGYSEFMYDKLELDENYGRNRANATPVDSLVVKYDSSGKTYYLSRGSSVFGEQYNTGYCYANTNFYWTDFLNDLITLKGSSNTSSGETVDDSGKMPRLISDLATYFRYNSYSKELRTTNVTGLKNGKNIQIQNMIMYAILVAQSLILFISYVKRLFYVILLAMMAPIVVVFDFFQKFGR